MKGRLLAVALLSTAATANATDWQIFSAAPDMTVYVAIDRIVRNGDYVETLQKLVFSKTQFDPSYRPYDYIVNSITVHCGSGGNSTRINSMTAYRKDGSTVYSASGTTEWTTVVPNSVGEEVANRVCGFK